MYMQPQLIIPKQVYHTRFHNKLSDLERKGKSQQLHKTACQEESNKIESQC